jgi:hypothetical protein
MSQEERKAEAATKEWMRRIVFSFKNLICINKTTQEQD